MIIDRIAPLWLRYGRRDASYSVNEFDPRHPFTLSYRGETLYLGDEDNLNRLSDQALIALLSSTFQRCAALAEQRKPKEKPRMYDESRANNDINDTKAEQAGKASAEALMPFLRLDVPHRALFALAMRVSRWEGYPSNAYFCQGFVTVLQDYQEVNAPRQLVIKNDHPEKA